MIDKLISSTSNSFEDASQSNSVKSSQPNKSNPSDSNLPDTNPFGVKMPPKNEQKVDKNNERPTQPMLFGHKQFTYKPEGETTGNKLLNPNSLMRRTNSKPSNNHV
jgi:hypothetical protein